VATTNPARSAQRASRIGAHGPALAFGATVVAAFAVLVLPIPALSKDIVLPLVSSLFLAGAAAIALLAWSRGRTSDSPHLTYWDVAGALTLIGICAGALIEPDQLLRIVRNP
jgi:hypothetical protein